MKISSYDQELHMDRYMESSMLKLVLSFSWRHTLVGLNSTNVKRTLKRWLDIARFSPDDPASNTPDILLIGSLSSSKWRMSDSYWSAVLGIALHDMLEANKGSSEAYSKALQEIKPLLEELTRTTRVIWYNTHITSDATFHGHVMSPFLSSMVSRYNNIVHGIFK